MNVERLRRIFIEPWPDSIQIALWKHRGFLHSFHDFSKSNAFSENLTRMKFILHKIFFHMSILQAAKPCGCSSIYIKKLLLDFQLIIIITVSIQVGVLN